MSLTLSIAFQIGEANLDKSLQSQSCLTLYFALRIAMHKLSRLEATIQASFASNVLLVSLAFLKPRPPFPFGRQSLSQAFHARYLPFCFFGFHQKCLEAASRLSQILAGILKEDVTYVRSV